MNYNRNRTKDHGHGGVMVIDFSTVGQNPLHPLGQELRTVIWNSLDVAEQDPAVGSIVLFGGGTNFSAGADITEFAKYESAGSLNDGSDNKVVSLVDIIDRIETFKKPVIAAISGICFGGGLEISLACHYRICDTTAKLGLPEVSIGVIPGGGGTQRLPRVVPLAKALEMILSAKPVNAVEAKKIGLVDELVNITGGSSGGGVGGTGIQTKKVDLLEVAKKWADWVTLMPLDDRRVGWKQIKETYREVEMICNAAGKKLPPVEMGGEGVHAALEAVKACRLPLKDGLAVESKMFFKTLTGSQGRARRHAFFAVRKAQKPLGRPPAGHPLLQKSLSNRTAAVVGAGLMGSGICVVLLQAGFGTVYLVDVYKESLEKGMSFLKGTVQSYVKRGRISEGKAAKLSKALKGTQDLEKLSSCDLVVEAVIEDMKIKKKIFSSFDKITPPECILLSNTSTLDIDEMAKAVSPHRRPMFAGWHFFSPAHVMKLVEIVRGKSTSMQTTCVLQQLTRRIGKIGVVVGNCDGFVGNRLLISYGAETTLLLEEGVASVPTVDKAFSRFGIALGPFQMADLAGLDVGYNIRKQRGWATIKGIRGKNQPARYPQIADVIVSEHGRLGQKSGKGWYNYDKKIGKGRKPLPSPEVDSLVRSFVQASPDLRQFTPTEMLERVLFPMVNEGFKCLEEGIANQPSDIDVIYLYGYGWPVYRGGPMWWADNDVGLPHLISKLEQFSKQFPNTDYYQPSDLLRKCVTMKLKVQEFYDLGLHVKPDDRKSKL
eukprot:CAMPEP_0113496966 /NCGR_PEP_ID=MMETSP0014_2-20120614/30389_1 /TAXON_ID=2857 /ORGANISM="Nitzschia sp." /LENGTH=770 /DNA_ID=CAMNT_0000390895 /DNA_START=56 /DNA_END=2368 /DNA_ORIENTATION=+ /assembly_acc=CAM_ASM_000159